MCLEKDLLVDVAEARALLDWYVAMGVDEALDEAGVDRFVPETPNAVAVQHQSPPVVSDGVRAPPVIHSLPVDQARNSAAALAAAAHTLEDLRAALERFDGCNLKASAHRLVFADGRAGAPLMLIGEAPGRDEDIAGKPFVGRAGQLLDRMLSAISLTREDVYIANVVPWRPPGNRTPTPQEVAVCLPFIARQIELAAPRLLAVLGGAAAGALCGSKEGITRLRGRWLRYHAGEIDIPVLPMLHPAYLLRTPVAKRHAWRDLLALRQALDELPSG